MDHILISVIIPVYNVENYVEECLTSVLQQQTGNIELIVVDDGSTDESYMICRKVIQFHADKKIQLFHQKNQGLAEARNKGLEKAMGKYIMFLDSDDMLMKCAFKTLESAVRRYPSLDIILFDAVIQNETSLNIPGKKYLRKDLVVSEVLTGQKYFQKYYCSHGVVSSCLRLYRKDFLKQNHISFCKGRLHEDIAYSFKTTWSASQLLYLPAPLYCRRYRENSITTEKKTKKHVRDQIYACRECIEFLGEQTVCGIELKNSVCAYLTNMFYYVVQQKQDVDLEMDEYQCLLADILKFLQCYRVDEKEYTFYKALEKILKVWNLDNCEMTPEIGGSLSSLMDGTDFPEIFEIIEKKLNLNQQKICGTLPLADRRKRIGIYGTGSHTRGIFDCYKVLRGEPKAAIVYVDSHKKSGMERFEGREIINIDDIKGRADALIISSFSYRLEMLKEIRDRGLDRYMDIIDFYEREKFPLF